MITYSFHLHKTKYNSVASSFSSSSFILGQEARLFYEILARQIKAKGSFWVNEVDILNDNFSFGIIEFINESKILLGNKERYVDEDVTSLLKSYCNGFSLKKEFSEKLIDFILDVYSLLMFKPLYLLIDLSNCNNEFYRHLLFLLLKLFPSYPLLILPNDYLSYEEKINFTSYLNIEKPKPFFVEDEKKIEQEGFDAFVNDFCEIKVAVPGELFEKKEEESLKEINIKFENNEKKEPVTKTKQPKIKEKRKFALTKELKDDLINLAFSLVFLILSCSTGPIFFSFQEPKAEWMFPVTLVMAILFLFMSNIPIGYLYEDKKAFDFRKNKVFGVSSILLPLLSLGYGIGFIIICKQKEYSFNEYISFGIFYCLYLIFEFIVLVHYFFKLKRNDKNETK